MSTIRRRPRVKALTGGGEPGAWGRTSPPCSQVSQSGLWISPVNGLGTLEHLRRGFLGSRGAWGARDGSSGHHTWIMRQTNTSTTNRSWYNNRFGVIIMSPLMTMKEDDFTEFARSRIIRWLRVQDHNAGIVPIG